MKQKILLLLLFIILLSQNIFAQESFEISELSPIEGIENCYITPSNGFYVNIVDEKGQLLIDKNFRSVDSKLGEYDTLLVYYAEGMADVSTGLLSKDLKIIVPQNFYNNIDFINVNENVYVAATGVFSENIDYYDLNGNKIDDPYTLNSYSKWAEESIKASIDLGIVPGDLQSYYTNKITRQEFCRLAVEAYISKTGSTIDFNIESPFTDVSDPYVTTAYNLNIVAGVGNNEFAPNNNITRQEAAVMLNNLASILNISINVNTEKFIDESYFASWAKDSIYNISGIGVMVGTEPNKFSPWMNYTREQAIATIYRLYNYE